MVSKQVLVSQETFGSKEIWASLNPLRFEKFKKSTLGNAKSSKIWASAKPHFSRMTFPHGVCKSTLSWFYTLAPIFIFFKTIHIDTLHVDAKSIYRNSQLRILKSAAIKGIFKSMGSSSVENVEKVSTQSFKRFSRIT